MIKTAEEMEPIQTEILNQLRAVFGPLIAVSSMVEKGLGWYVNVLPLRAFSKNEITQMETILRQFDVPIRIDGPNKPSRHLTKTVKQAVP